MFLTPRTTRFPGGPRVLRQTLETIDLCIAYREAQGASVERFLAGWAAGTARPAPPRLKRERADSL